MCFHIKNTTKHLKHKKSELITCKVNCTDTVPNDCRVDPSKDQQCIKDQKRLSTDISAALLTSQSPHQHQVSFLHQ